MFVSGAHGFEGGKIVILEAVTIYPGAKLASMAIPDV
jgi:hypothetical protein